MKDERREKTSGRSARMPVGCRERERRFELKAALTPGGSATAYQRVWDGAAWQTIVDSRAEFTVVDDLGLHRGRGRDAFGSPNDAGSKGRARWDGETDRWVILWMEPSALMIRGVTYAVVATTDATFGIDSLSLIQPIGALITDQNPAAWITVQNTYEWEADAGAPAAAVWNEAEAEWEAIQVACPTVYY